MPGCFTQFCEHLKNFIPRGDPILDSNIASATSPLKAHNVVICNEIPANEHRVLVYIDPGFRIGRHYVNMAETLSTECAARGMKLRHYVGKDVPDAIAEKYALRRVFGCNAKPGNAAQSLFCLEMRAILDDLITNYGRDTELIFYMYCGRPAHFVAISELVSLPQHNQVNFKFYINLSYQDLNSGKTPEDYAEELKLVSNLWEAEDNARRIIGVMDNQQSINRYQSCFRRELRLAPIPLYHQKPNTGQQSEKSGSITIGYFGQLVEEQGYLLATKVYEEFIQNRDQPGLEFLMRVNRNCGHGYLCEHFEEFRKKSDRITIVEGFVETKQHLSLVSQSDIVILPYLKERYPFRTSGVFIDALIHNKVIVAPRETWMEDMIMRYGAGATFISGDLTSLIDALDWAIQEYHLLAHCVSRDVTEIYSQFSANSLLEIMCEG